MRAGQLSSPALHPELVRRRRSDWRKRRQIIIADRDKAEKTLRLVAEFGGKATAFQCDVTHPTSVEAFRTAVDSAGARCDILVNNAGIYPMQTFDEMTFEDWRHVLTVNLNSMFLMTKAFIDGMKRRKWGRIVNIASDTVNLVLPGFTHYVASKAGVIGFTRSLATEYGQSGITANAIAPGLTRTPGTEAREEIAGGMSQRSFLQPMRICRQSSACRRCLISWGSFHFWQAKTLPS